MANNNQSKSNNTGFSSMNENEKPQISKKGDIVKQKDDEFHKTADNKNKKHMTK